jgi:DNA-directed RNA polymerase subunit RPC12/RpoP
MCYNNGSAMKLKLDLHPIYNDSRAIDAALNGIMDEATEKRTTELEIITGKGSGQLKKSVLRFLDQPDVRARYHRIEKDGDNWGRLFVHFRWERLQAAKAVAAPPETASYACFCCGAAVSVPVSAEALREGGPEERVAECPACGSPNHLSLHLDRRGQVQVRAESGYDAP